MLTFAVVDVNDGVLILQGLGDAADEALRALGRGVDSDEVEGTLCRHFERFEEFKIAKSEGTLSHLIASPLGLLHNVGGAPPAYPSG